MGERKKILYLAGTDPRSTSYGGEQRTHFVWEGLKKVAEVHTVIPAAHKSQERANEEDSIRWVCFERRWTPSWIVRRMWSRLFPRIGLPCGDVRKRIKSVFSFSFDACVVRHVTLASYLKAWQIAPMYLDADDNLTEAFDSLYIERKKTMVQKVKRAVIHSYESFIFARAKHIWVANPKHCHQHATLNVSVLPNIPCALPTSCWNSLGKDFSMLFVGALNCDQNYWGIDFFLDNYWSDLLVRFPKMRFRIAGTGLPQHYIEKWAKHERIELLGFVDNLASLYEECMCVVTPLYVGSGSSIKVREALFAGRVCVASPYAVRGLAMSECCEGNGILVFNGKDELLQAFEKLIIPEKRLDMQRAAHQFMAKNFSQEQVDKVIAVTFKQDVRGTATIQRRQWK